MRTSVTAAIESSETPIATSTNALTQLVGFQSQCRLIGINRPVGERIVEDAITDNTRIYMRSVSISAESAPGCCRRLG
jgi:hypothetical protein